MIWNPPLGIDLGIITLRFYSLCFVIAFSLGWYLMKQIYLRENKTLAQLDSIFVHAVLATLIGARLGHVIFYDWAYYQDHLLEIFLPFQFEPEFKFTGFQGLASHGAALAFILAMWRYARKVIHKPTLWVLDRISIPAAFGGIFVRIGNFFNSEIIGVPTDSVFGVRFIRAYISKYTAIRSTGIKHPRTAYQKIIEDSKFKNLLDQVPSCHPAQLYESFGYIFVSFFLWYLYWKTSKREQLGFIFGMYLLGIFTVRFFVEYVKKSQEGFGDVAESMFSTGQLLSIPFVICGIYLILKPKKL